MKPEQEDRLCAAFAKAMDRLQRTEGGKVIRGLVVTKRPWIYWSVTDSAMSCERCGRTERTPTVPLIFGRETLRLFANRLSPFDRDHAGCQRRVLAH